MKTTPLQVCDDCLQIAIYDDPTGLDYYLDEEQASARYEHILNEISKLDGFLALGDDDHHEYLSTCPCEICGDSLHGERYELLLCKD